MKKKLFIYPLIILLFLLFIYLIYSGIDLKPQKNSSSITDLKQLKNEWAEFSGGKKGKLVYAVPPDMFILYLHTGKVKKLKGVITEGGKGRFNRGKTPRPFWFPDGKFFVYRYKGAIFLCNEDGEKREIKNDFMDTSKETRWSPVFLNNKKWIFGPSKFKSGILVNIKNPTEYKEIFKHRLIEKHCELTADGKYIVYDNGKNIILADITKGEEGEKISKGQSCRPCASPSFYIAWLPAPHIKYFLHRTKDTQKIKPLFAPEGEEIYRLNWSNVENYAVHMFGSRGNTKITVRKIESGKSIAAGYGWDPDLWIRE